MTLTLIAAVADDGAIGRQGDLPWRLKADLRRFKERTLDQTLILGRKTFASIGRALPRRRMIVLSRQPPEAIEPPLPPGVEHAASLDEAMARTDPDQEVFVAGGEAVYWEALPRADRLDLTRVHTTVPDGDTWFPEGFEESFTRTEAREVPADEDNEHAMTFETWVRARS